MGKGPRTEPEDQRLFHLLAELPGLRWASQTVGGRWAKA